MTTANCKSWMNPGFAILLFGMATLSGTAQNFDNSATSTVKGAYFVRQVLTIPDLDTSAITRALSLIGTMTFDGLGTYSFTGQLMDSQSGTAQAFSTTGGYGVSANGFAELQNPIDNYLAPLAALRDLEYGAVGALGPTAIVASSTESSNRYKDIFIAVPAGAGVTNGSVQGTYRVGFIDFLQANASQVRDGFYSLTSTGNGSFGTVAITGSMANQGNTAANQNLSGVTYSIASATGSGTITFPTSPSPLTALVSGQKTFYLSADGNIMLGGSFNGFDLMVGIKANAGPANNGTYQGTYYLAGLENINGCIASACMQSLYGSTSATGSGLAVGHIRLTGYSFPAFDSTFDYLPYNVGSDGTFADVGFQYLLGASGQAILFIGNGSSYGYSLRVGLHAIAYPATTVFLNPVGIVNAASFAPITNSVAPGEYVALFGSGLAAATLVAPTFPLQTTLGGVQVTVNGTPAPIHFVSAGQINFIMPYSTPTTINIATIQVSNNGTKSNPITVYTAASAPGVLTQPGNGIGPAKVTHLDGSLVTASNPAKAGETLVAYVVGLGAVAPAVADGAAAPSSPLSTVIDQDVFVDIQDQNYGLHFTTLLFAGLTPGYPSLYQLNFTLPSGADAVPSGQCWLNINTHDAYTSEAKIFVQ